MGREKVKPPRNHKEKAQKINKDLDKIIDMVFTQIVWRLSPILGGRTEVLETPMMEALEYLKLEKAKRENDRMEQFSLMFFAANSNVDAKARQKYYESIRPKDQGGKVLGNPTKQLGWDPELMKQLKAAQENGG